MAGAGGALIVRDVQAGKAKRVLGTFAILLGGGLWLEGPILWPGMLLASIGALLLVWGFHELRGRQAPGLDEGGQE